MLGEQAGFQPFGPSSTTSSRSTRTAPLPKRSTGPSRRRRAAPDRLRRPALPYPYNHPVRSPSAAVLDLVWTAASSSAPAARRPGPSSRASASTRIAYPRAVGGGGRARRGRLDRRRLRVARAALRLPKRKVHPKPLQDPHPPLWGATSSPRATSSWASWARACSRSQSGPARRAQRADQPVPRRPRHARSRSEVLRTRGTFTMVHVAPTRDKRARPPRVVPMVRADGAPHDGLGVELDARVGQALGNL